MQNNANEPFDLLANTDTPRIIVAPTYRLNIFGFLASTALAELKEDPAPSNYGFWDQRLALEWISRNIALFGGDADNITVGGLSAGAYSALFQLYYDTYLLEDQRIIKRAFFWSNAVGIQPNSFDSAASNNQFDELLDHFSISKSASASKKIDRLRNIPAQDLVTAIISLKYHTFRAVTDSCFIISSFLKTIRDGSFASLLHAHNVSLMIGEVADEALLYRLVNPPSSLPGLRTQLQNYYPVEVAEALIKHYQLPEENAPADAWADIYAQIVADCQVHATIRGLRTLSFQQLREEMACR